MMKNTWGCSFLRTPFLRIKSFQPSDFLLLYRKRAWVSQVSRPWGDRSCANLASFLPIFPIPLLVARMWATQCKITILFMQSYNIHFLFAPWCNLSIWWYHFSSGTHFFHCHSAQHHGVTTVVLHIYIGAILGKQNNGILCDKTA